MRVNVIIKQRAVEEWSGSMEVPDGLSSKELQEYVDQQSNHSIDFDELIETNDMVITSVKIEE